MKVTRAVAAGAVALSMAACAAEMGASVEGMVMNQGEGAVSELTQVKHEPEVLLAELSVIRSYDARHEGATVRTIDGLPATRLLWQSILDDASLRYDTSEGPVGRILDLSSGEIATLTFGSVLHARETWHEGEEGSEMRLEMRWEHRPSIELG